MRRNVTPGGQAHAQHEHASHRGGKMVKSILICAALAAATLTGCTGLNADVHTANPAAALRGERTYTIARMPSQDASADHPQFEALLRDELAKHGFADASAQQAHYLLSIAYATRPAGVGVNAADCAAGACGRPAEP